MLNKMVRISELQQKQSHWTIENGLCGTRESLAPVGGFMNRTMPFTTEGKESPGSENGRSTQGDLRDNAAAPRLIACLLLVPEDAHAILTFLQKLAGRDRSPDRATSEGNTSGQSAPDDSWLGHSEAAAYLGVSKSTLYHYSSGEQIERRKLGGRLEYRRSALDHFKQAHTQRFRNEDC
jgi:predicted DNA-binding transcriptional regulator AlpA